ncbi:MAG: hypothetical protein WA154_11125 [Moraxellaceae bacterium]
MQIKKIAVSAAIVAALAVANEYRQKCPDCGRLKARSADDAMNGDCDKWYATRDKEAHAECARVAAAKKEQEHE